MYSKFLDSYQTFGETARAKSEAVAARAAFLTGVMEQGYRLWLTLVTTEMNEAMRTAQDLAVCKTPAEVAEVQSAWLQASSARAITSLQGIIEISNFLIKNLQENAAAIATVPAAPAKPVSGPVVPPVAFVVPAPAPAPAPVVASANPLEVAPAPTATPAPAPKPRTRQPKA